jgi:hypothetical protein
MGERFNGPYLLTELKVGWNYSVDTDGRLTISPSILDRGTCQAHYFIQGGFVKWC